MTKQTWLKITCLYFLHWLGLEKHEREFVDNITATYRKEDIRDVPYEDLTQKQAEWLEKLTKKYLW